jgi:hypothetical protein
VEFAGYYTIPTWGCGTDCEEFVIVDSISGKVYDEFWLSGFPGDWWQNHKIDNERKKFHPDSAMLKIDGCPRDRDCGSYDYQMVDGEGLKLIRRRLLPKQYQP